jgi:hypothetical protein
MTEPSVDNARTLKRPEAKRSRQLFNFATVGAMNFGQSDDSRTWQIATFRAKCAGLGLAWFCGDLEPERRDLAAERKRVERTMPRHEGAHAGASG